MGFFRLTKTFRFEASHQLPHHSGKCQRLHGHSWKVELIVEGTYLESTGSSTGMMMDFSDIAEPTNRLLEEKLDHFHLNDSTGLENPTSEELARWIFKELWTDIRALKAVIVHETCTCSAEYRP